MKIKVLGSGAWEGIPAPFCGCKVCVISKKDVTSKNNRTRPQFLVTSSDGGFFMEASPDIRLQSAAIGSAEVTNFLISHSHHDHITGLRELHSWALRASQKPVVHCSAETEKHIKNELSYLPITINTLKPYEQFSLFGVKITPLPVCHMFAQDENTPEESLQNTFAFLLETDGRSVAYLADYYKIPQRALEKLKNIDAVIVDGTYLLTEKYKGKKLNHLHGQSIIEFASSLNVGKVYYHSVSHLTAMTHDELQALLPSGHMLAYDGLEI